MFISSSFTCLLMSCVIHSHRYWYWDGVYGQVVTCLGLYEESEREICRRVATQISMKAKIQERETFRKFDVDIVRHSQVVGQVVSQFSSQEDSVDICGQGDRRAEQLDW